MRTVFGTDGIRSRVNQGSMTPGKVLEIGLSTAEYFLHQNSFDKNRPHRFTVVIGKDTRLSGYMVESSLVSGFVSMGADVVLVGPMPTPAIAMLTRSLRADLGLMISASHNPFSDNGIKFFDANGNKLDDSIERSIELILEHREWQLVMPEDFGRAKRLDDANGRYIEFAKSLFSKTLRLDGMRIVIDCANGAGYKIAPKVLWELGAEVITINDSPNGLNINKNCGATCPKSLQDAIRVHRADIGFALDGDADRLIVIDEKANVLDGDQLMAVIATHWHHLGALKNNTIVATHMSNLGMDRYLLSEGIRVHRTQVGDRYVAQAMRELGCNLGGEQSGHIIFADYSSTGDGLVAALQFLQAMLEKNKSPSELGSSFTPVAQKLKNISLIYPVSLDDPKFLNLEQDARQRLGSNGFLLVRRSGTEPLVRLMAQGDDLHVVESCIEEISDLLHHLSHLNQPK
jgi:phosphoglucosamine mutase